MFKRIVTQALAAVISLQLFLSACSSNEATVGADAGLPSGCEIAELAQCDTNATCSIVEGIATCSCIDGFSGNGVSCEEGDACASGVSPCSEDATCENIAGIAECTCDMGWEGNGLSCTNTDECADETSDCDTLSQNCIDNDGGFSCVCKDGFIDEGTGCTLNAETFVADISARPVTIQIQGIGTYEVGGLGRIAVEIEMVSTPAAGNVVERVPNAVIYHNVTLRNLSRLGGGSVPELADWASGGNDPRDAIVELSGLGTEALSLLLSGVRPVSSDITINNDTLSEIVLSIGFLSDRSDGYIPAIPTGMADDATIVEVEGIGDLPFSADNIETVPTDTAGFLSLSSLGNGSSGNGFSFWIWMKDSIQQFNATGDVERKSLSQIFTSGGTEVSRVNCFETFPSLFVFFNPTKTYGQTPLFDLTVASELCQDS